MKLSLGKITAFVGGSITRSLYLYTVIVAIFLLFVISITIWAGNTLAMITAIARFERTHTVSRVEAMVALLNFHDNNRPEELELFQSKMAITQSYNRVFSRLLDMRKNTPDAEFVKILENTFSETDHVTAVIIVNRIKVLYWHPILKALVADATTANAEGEKIKIQVAKFIGANNEAERLSKLAEIEKSGKKFTSLEISFSKNCSELANHISLYVNYITTLLLVISVGFTGLLTYLIARSLIQQAARYTSDLEKEIQFRKLTENDLLSLKDRLQEQNEKLQINEEELRWQNDELLSTEEMLRVQINEYETSQNLLKDSEGRLRKLSSEQRIILNSSSIGVIFVKNRKVLWANPAHCRMFGYEVDESQNMDTAVYYVDTESYEYIGKKAYQFITTGGVFSEDLMMKKKGGALFWCNLVGQAINPQNVEEGSIWSIQDISERKQAEVDLRIAATAFESQEGMMITDVDAMILRVNQAFTEISGYTEEEVLGKNPRILKSDRHNPEFYKEMWESINRTGGWQGEIWDKRKNGEEYPKWLTISAVKDKDGKVTNYIGAHYDITERTKAEEEINELAFFDQLTGLPNRTLLLDRLKQTMTASSRTGSYCALLFLDLDDFKTLNDTLGHDLGDELLKQVAQRLTTCVRAGDTSARIGGDEFVIILINLSTDKRTAASQAEVIGEKILAALNQSYHLKDITYHSTPSIGATLFSGDQAEIEDLLRQSDIAMYKAKDAGRNTMRFFDPEMETVVKKRAALEKDLRNAVHENQFLLHYQAQMAGGQLTGSEALVRWHHPERGMVSPVDFIPLAEESRLILPLGQWVLETACRQLSQWAAHPDMAHLTVAVNVSAHQFHQADFVDQVLAILHSTGANPQRLKLELTESMLVSNMNLIIEKMFALKGKGVGFSLDDFGTGYSSLSYLKRLPLDQLKIDKSFVRDVLIDHNDATIVRTIIALAQNLGFGIIAEGVETAEQRDFLSSSGCHAYQGHFYSRPLPIEGFEEFARRV